ncbi:MAG: SDR family oxidoreductase [Candidatus Thermoplasmatota archaeon]|nr:SDR family oxidoreductase [Candidatus Thermoplasmatota archaeon]MBU4144253.1 SDR family oxidoreductase [Candidatus Thermoplasmatota archaeon]
MTKGKLEGKVAIVTGASSGIGKAIARRYADEGASVVVCSRNIDACIKVRDEIQKKNQQSFAVRCDVRIEKEVVDLFANTIAKYGGIDIVVASAGISGGNKKVEDYTLEQWNNVLETNLTGVFLTLREAFKRMKERGGHIIVISSQAGVEGYSGKGAYCASKFGARGISHVLSEEGRPFNINVSSLCPGTVETPILAASNTKVKHPMSVDAVADAAVFLASLGGNSLIRDILLERMNLN